MVNCLDASIMLNLVFAFELALTLELYNSLQFTKQNMLCLSPHVY